MLNFSTKVSSLNDTLLMFVHSLIVGGHYLTSMVNSATKSEFTGSFSSKTKRFKFSKFFLFPPQLFQLKQPAPINYQLQKIQSITFFSLEQSSLYEVAVCSYWKTLYLLSKSTQKQISMNLTISNYQSLQRNYASSYTPSPASKKHHTEQVSTITKTKKIESFGDSRPDCASTFFGNCVDPVQFHQSEKNEVYEASVPLREEEVSPIVNLQHEVQLREHKSLGRKHKISLSLRQSKMSSQTPKKFESNKKEVLGFQSNKKSKTEQAEDVQERPRSENKERQKIKINKIKTEPKREKHQFVNVHQMKESLKPSTNIGSAGKQSPITGRKTKLSLTNSYKSQVQSLAESLAKEKLIQDDPNIVRQSKIVNSLDVMVEESFMTAKLVNIYGEMSNNDDLYIPSSNIVYYNKLMAAEQKWKTPVKNDSEPEVQKYRSPEDSLNHYDQTSPKTQHNQQQASIQQQTQQNGIAQNENLPEDDRKYPEGIKSKFKGQRKWLGEYAKTIKTFNESDFKSVSEEESIVLQHGNLGGNFMMMLPLNRGSIKDMSRQQQSEEAIPKRPYNSFGDDGVDIVMMNKDKHKRFINQPIEEDDNDSQRQI